MLSGLLAAHLGSHPNKSNHGVSSPTKNNEPNKAIEGRAKPSYLLLPPVYVLRCKREHHDDDDDDRQMLFD